MHSSEYLTRVGELDHSYLTAQFIIDGYKKPFRFNRNKDGGGFLIFVRDDIPSTILDKHKLPKDIEGLFIEINFRKSKLLLFGTYPRPVRAITIILIVKVKHSCLTSKFMIRYY